MGGLKYLLWAIVMFFSRYKIKWLLANFWHCFILCLSGSEWCKFDTIGDLKGPLDKPAAVIQCGGCSYCCWILLAIMGMSMGSQLCLKKNLVAQMSRAAGDAAERSFDEIGGDDANSDIIIAMLILVAVLVVTLVVYRLKKRQAPSDPAAPRGFEGF